MPVRRLPSNPNLDHLKYQAKDLLRDHVGRDLGVAQRIREFHPRFNRATDTEIFDTQLSLGDAQLTIAREYGFPSWTRLKQHIEKPAVLEFVAENPVRHGTLPQNVVQVAKAILDAGVEQSALNETLMLVATGSVPRECRVQLPLIDFLCDRGADPDSAIEAATLHGELEAVNALIGRGARINLPVAAALRPIEDFRRLLPVADSRNRHLALALASQLGLVEIVRLLLDAGEDPNRYNPVGGHSHTTPLHQAAGAGYDELV